MLIGIMAIVGLGIGGALEKSQLQQIVSWVSEELPEEKPRHRA